MDLKTMLQPLNVVYSELILAQSFPIDFLIIYFWKGGIYDAFTFFIFLPAVLLPGGSILIIYNFTTIDKLPTAGLCL